MTSWTMCVVRAREMERRASGVARPRATRWESWWHVHVPGQPDEEAALKEILDGPVRGPVWCGSFECGVVLLRLDETMYLVCMVLNDHIRVMNDDMYPPGICP